jgi:regulator of sigma E protease
MLTGIVFLLILTTAVLVHELAHYWNAKSVGLPVKAFSIGMGPVIWRKQWRETEWRIAALPIGGYVDIPGMAPRQDEMGNLHHPSEGFATKNLWQKLWVLVGGVLANYILAILLLSLVITLEPGYRELTSGIPTEVSGAKVADVIFGKTAEDVGVQKDDIILSINGVENPEPSQVTEAIKTTNGSLDFVLERKGEKVELSVPWPPKGVSERPLFGVKLTALNVTLPPKINYFQALGEVLRFSIRIIPESLKGFVGGIGSAFKGEQNNNVAGPIGIVGAVNQATKVGIIPVIALAALINFSLAIFNLLPIPGLDGGRMLLSTIIAIRGKPFKPGQEEFIHFLGFMSVLGLMLLITFNEMAGLFRN